MRTLGETNPHTGMGHWMLDFIAVLAILGFQLVFAMELGLITRKPSCGYYGGFLLLMMVHTFQRYQVVHGWDWGTEE